LFRVVASGDRDGKLRVSELPKDPKAGCWTIVAYCLGHTAAITCCTFITIADKHILVSGALDGQIIAWDWQTGVELCSCSPGKDAGSTTAGAAQTPARHPPP
jgi:WD40 repeat protein